jgi:hypothetical protein
MFVANANGEPKLYRNTMPAGPHWVEFLMQGKGKSNRQAVGTQLRLTAGATTWLHYVDGGNSFAGQSSARVHYGLAKNGKFDRLEVRWPSGRKEAFDGLAADKLHRILEGTGKETK